MARQADGTIYIDTNIDTEGFGSGVNNMKSSLGGLTKSLSKLGLVIGSVFAVGELVKFSKEAIELGSDLQEVQNVVDVTFTTLSKEVDDFAKSAAKTAGLSETMAKRYAGTFGSMAAAFGFAEDNAYEMATALTQLSGDIASFYNITQDEAYTKLKSIFTGETESLKDLGVVMTQTALDSFAMQKGIGKVTSNMTEQEKVALRYQFVLEQLSNASGDFQRTSDGWANQMRIMNLNIESLKANIGQGLINLFTPLVQVLNAVIERLAVAGTKFKEFTELVMGRRQTQGANNVAKSVDNLGKSYGLSTEGVDDFTESVNKATKATKKSLSPLDNLNNLTSNMAEDLGDFGFGDISVTTPDASLNIQGTEEVSNLSGFLDDVIKKVTELSPELNDLFNLVTKPITENKDGFILAMANHAEYTSKIIQTITSGIEEAVVFFRTVYEEKISPIIQSLTEDISKYVGLFLEWWNEDMSPVLDKWSERFDKMWNEHMSPFFKNFAEAWGEIWDNVKAIWDEVFDPLVDWFLDDVLPFITPAIEELGNKAIEMIGFIADVASGLTDIFSGLITFLTGTFLGDWKRAWNGLTDIFKGIVNILISAIELLANNIVRMLNSSLIKPVNDVAGVVGFKTVLPVIPELNIPRLATGAVIPPNAPFMAMLGDQRNGTNIEAPLDTIKQGLSEVLAEMGINVTFEVEGDEAGIFRVTQRQAKMYTKQTGRPAY